MCLLLCLLGEFFLVKITLPHNHILNSFSANLACLLFYVSLSSFFHLVIVWFIYFYAPFLTFLCLNGLGLFCVNYI